MTTGGRKFWNFILEKGCLVGGTSEIFEKNKVQVVKWPVPSYSVLIISYYRCDEFYKIEYFGNFTDKS